MDILEILYFILLAILVLKILLNVLDLISENRFINNLIGDEVEGPILAASELLENTSKDSKLQSMHKGTLHGYTYNFMYNGSRLMVLVSLGYDTNVHLVAIGDNAKITSRGVFFSNKWLKQVKLEGNFPDYFRLYCTPGKEISLLSVFEPKTMAYFIDFCREYNLEIFRDILYISHNENSKESDDETSVIADLENFLKDQHDTLKRLHL